ncbi:MAG: MFS transporter [Acidobacteria bacterium]|nr:MFS transporter [Acidobacteriota bacterium]
MTDDSAVASIRHGLPYYAAFVGLGLTGAALGPTLPSLAEQTHSALADVAILFTVESLGYMLGTIVAGRLVDRVQGHPVLVAVLAWMAGALALVPWFETLGATMAVLWAVGLGMGMLDVGCNTLIVWRYRERSGPYLNGLHSVYAVGAFLSPIVLSQVQLRTGSLPMAFGTLSAMLVPAAVSLLFVDSPVRLQRTRASDRQSFDRSFVATGAVFFFVYTGAEAASGGWIFTYAVRSGLTTAESGAYLTALFWGAVAIGRLIATAAATRYEAGGILLTTLPISVASVGLMLAALGEGFIWFGTFVLGLSVAAVFPTMLALIGTRTPVTGLVNSVLFASASCGAMFFPWLIGQVFEPLGPRSALVVIGINLTLSTALVLLLRARRAALRTDEAVT